MKRDRLSRACIALIVLAALSAPAFGTGAVEEAEPDVMSITWLGPNPRGNIVPADSYIEQRLEERFGVELTPVPVDFQNTEQVQVYLAANDPPDYIYRFREDLITYARNGIIRPLESSDIEEAAPYLYSVINKLSPDGLAWLLSSYEDQLYGVPLVDVTQSAGFPLSLRQDWMESVGVTEVPETVADLEMVFDKFVNEDPDGNGSDDTYGISGKGYGSSKSLLASIYGAYGIMPSEFVIRDGAVVFADMTEEYRDLLKLLNSWYDAGILDPETVLTSNPYNEKFWNGVTGALNISWPHLNLGNPNSMWSRLVQNDPDAEQVLINKLVGPDGYFGSRSWNIAIGHSGMFGANVDDAKMETILSMLNAIHSDLDLYRLAQFGEEGIHHTYSPETGVVWTEEYQSAEGQASIGALKYLMHLFIDEQHLQTFSAVDRQYIDYALSVEGVAVPFPTSIVPSYLEISADVQRVASEFWANAIAGRIDIDAEWDGFVQTLEDLGMPEVLADANEIYAAID